MKVSIFGASLLLMASFGALAQEIPAGDPGYNTGNYKHPNKAAAAAKKAKYVTQTEQVVSNRNYKQSLGSKTVESGLVIEKTSSTEPINYKMPYTKKVKKSTKKSVKIANKVTKMEYFNLRRLIYVGSGSSLNAPGTDQHKKYKLPFTGAKYGLD